MSDLRIPEPWEYKGHLPDDFNGEVLSICDIAWSGWEADFGALLVRWPDGKKELISLGETGMVPGRTEDILADRIIAYGLLVRQTEALCRQLI